MSRGSVREAVRVLEFAGVLEVRSGSGTYVTQDALSNTTTLRVAAASAGDHSPLDVIVARRALEPLCARLAAERRHEHDLDEIRAAYDEQEVNVRAGTDPTDADITFHKMIARASHNTALMLLVEQIMGVVSQQLWRDIKLDSLARSGRPERYLDEHRAILGAIVSGDAAGAEAAMAAHLEAVEQGLVDVVSSDA